MKFLLYLIFIGLFVKACEKPTSLPKKILIPGTHVKVLPFGNYSFTKNTTGLQWGQDVVLEIMDFPGNNFHTTEVTFTKEGLEKRGLKVYEFTDTIMNGYSTKLAYVEDNTLLKKFLFTFGDSTFSCLGTSIYTENFEKDYKKEIKRTLLSIEYDKNIKIDPYATARFQINGGDEDLKYSLYTGGSYYYTLDGNPNLKHVPDGPILVILPEPYSSGLKLDDYHLMITKSFVNNQILNYSIESEKDTTLNSFKCLQTIGYANLNNKKVLVCITILQKQDNVLGIEAISYSHFENDLRRFKDFINTIVPK